MFRPLPIMTVLSIASLAVLILLGNWQWEKYADKMGRPAAEAAKAPPVLSLSFTALSPESSRPQKVYGIADGESIWRRYVAAARNDTGDRVLLAVDALGGANPSGADVPLPADAVSAMRDVRVFQRQGSPSPRNVPAESLWYSFDRAGLLTAFGLEDGQVPVAEPVEITVRNLENPNQTRTTQNPYGAPRRIDPLPPQRHLGYALTWWGLAMALIGVYAAYHMGQGRLSFGRRE